MVQGFRQWHKKSPFSLLGYHTTIWTSVSATLYSLVYGTEVVILVEIVIPSLRVVVKDKIDDDQWVKNRLEQLSLIDEKRLISIEAKGKFFPNWQGPFWVKRVLPNGALYLTDIASKMEEMIVNANAVKGYYV
ncbi:uncharacterized protein LOC124898004 [Capsicum annuum]|uniref:uncharacterized protein LOC124898004 n=1 Tax=Capsicum annuum TaxID=4072 RepID=UPI001FB0FD0D|nr:uncharacterized protein LOC124898004 [Capsicum annuum]